MPHKSFRRFVKQLTQESRRPGFRLGLESRKTSGTSPTGGAPDRPRVSTTEGPGPKETSRQDVATRTKLGFAALGGALGVAAALSERDIAREAAQTGRREEQADIVRAAEEKKAAEAEKLAADKAAAETAGAVTAQGKKKRRLRGQTALISTTAIGVLGEPTTGRRRLTAF